MELSGQLHTLVTLPTEKKNPGAHWKEAGWALSQFGHFGKEKIYVIEGFRRGRNVASFKSSDAADGRRRLY
jgi:hypothetical protein